MTEPRPRPPRAGRHWFSRTRSSCGQATSGCSARSVSTSQRRDDTPPRPITSRVTRGSAVTRTRSRCATPPSRRRTVAPPRPAPPRAGNAPRDGGPFDGPDSVVRFATDHERWIADRPERRGHLPCSPAGADDADGPSCPPLASTHGWRHRCWRRGMPPRRSAGHRSSPSR